jgi:hypothetical protein
VHAAGKRGHHPTARNVTCEHWAKATRGCAANRAQSGFRENAFVTYLEGELINYIIAQELNCPLQRAQVRATQSAQDAPPALGWWTLDDGLELTEMKHRAPN